SDVGPLGRANAQIVAPGEAEIARALHEPQAARRLISQKVDGAVSGPVLYHHDFERWVGLGVQRIQTLRQVGEAIPVHHDDGDEGAFAVPRPGPRREFGGCAPRVRDSRHSIHYIARVLAPWPRIPRAPRRPRPSITRNISTTSTSCVRTG